MSKPARLAAVTATLVLVVTALVVSGWVSGYTVLRQGRSDWASMTPATGTCLAVLAGAVLCTVLRGPERPSRAGDRGSRRLRTIAQWATYGVGLLGAVALVEFATNTDPVAGHLFGTGRLRMTPAAAGAIVLLAAGLSLRERWQVAGQVLLVLGGLPGYVALIGYGTGVTELYAAGASMSMAIATASALPLVALAGLAAMPEGWIARIQAADTPSRLLLRTVVPPAVVLIPAIAAMAGAGAAHDWWTNSVAVALQSLGATVVAVGGALWGARAIGQKDVNDRYGHLEGDRVLAGFASRVRTNLRADDVLIRVGGDEFAVVCTHADPNAVLAIVNRILLALERWKSQERGPAVTASIGVAVCDGTVGTRHELLGRADAALYTAKHSGKSRFCFHPTAWSEAS